MTKVGFLGCSYSAYDQKSVQENSWTYQLAQKFPQHQYYNYALGGRGIDYLKWCLLDAKEQNIDIIFVNTTYPSRVGYLVDGGSSLDNFTFVDTKITENFKLRQLESPHVWANHGVLGHNKYSGRLFQDAINLQSISENRNTYIKKFYKNITKLYNFKHIVMLNFVSEHKFMDENCVWYQIYKQFNAYNMETLYNAGIILGLDDDHWTFKGNQWVLDNFVLTKEVIDILNHS